MPLFVTFSEYPIEIIEEFSGTMLAVIRVKGEQMKITIYPWHNSEKEISAIKEAGFVPNEPVEVTDAFLAMQKIYGDGGSVNVAILKANIFRKIDGYFSDAKTISIAVSDDYFRQR